MELFTVIGVVWAVMLVFRALAVRMEADERVEALKAEADERIRMVTLETVPEHENLIFAYDIENNQFLGQGTSVEEVKSRIIERFPQKIFLLDNKVFTGLKTKLEVDLEKSNAS